MFQNSIESWCRWSQYLVAHWYNWEFWQLRILTISFTQMKRYHLLAYGVMALSHTPQRIRMRKRHQGDVPVSWRSKCFWDWVEQCQRIAICWNSKWSDRFKRNISRGSLSAYCSISPINHFQVGYSCWKTILCGSSRTVWHHTIAWRKRCIGERRSSMEFARGISFKSIEAYIDSWQQLVVCILLSHLYCGKS